MRTSHTERRRWVLFAAIMVALAVNFAGSTLDRWQWRQLAPLPAAQGFAGGFAGASGGVLLFAGGTNFPDRPPWEGGTKTWHGGMFVLEAADGTWVGAGDLARPLAYGASVSIAEGMVCIGGGDAERHYADVFLLQWKDGTVIPTPLPALPQPTAYGAAVVHGRSIYFSGGTNSPSATSTQSFLWVLDLDGMQRGWRPASRPPGRGRLMSLMAATSREIFVFGGYDLHVDGSGKTQRVMLRDGFAFNPATETWRKLADLPRAVVGVPSPGTLTDDDTITLLGWNDGSLAAIPPGSERPDFPRDCLLYDVRGDAWRVAPPLPFAQKVTPAVPWADGLAIVSGEVQPGIRTRAVWFGRPPRSH